MATFSVQVKKCDSCDILSWFHQFECWSNANTWNEEKQLHLLSVFLRGPAAAYFLALLDKVNGLYQNLTEHLLASFCPAVDYERTSATFEHLIRPNKDPTILLWNLKDLIFHP